MSEHRFDALDEYWYLLGQPWCHSEQSGFTILAGDCDPHIATVVCDLQPISEDMNDDEAREVAAHIVELHNRHLYEKQRGGRPAIETD